MALNDSPDYEADIAIDADLETRTLAEVDAVSDEMIEAIRSIVQQKSVQDEPRPGAPFGAGVRAALDQTLERCQKLGFETVNVDGYAGYARWTPEASKGADVLPGYVCALGHLDVVPEGTTGWKVPPYSGHLENGRITSRGVLDNKGPIYSCLYALWALKGLGLEPRREVRIIFGCNEESGFNDLRYYLDHEPAPVMGFTPDCKYPVVYAERGCIGVRLTAETGDGEDAEACLAQFFTFLNEFILNAKSNGERFGIDVVDPEFGSTEVRNYHVMLDEGAPAVEFAISYPAGITARELKQCLSTVAAEQGLALTVTGNFGPDVVMCGPTFNYGEYAQMACRIATDLETDGSMHAIAAVSQENADVIEYYKDKVLIVKTPRRVVPGSMRRSRTCASWPRGSSMVPI